MRRVAWWGWIAMAVFGCGERPIREVLQGSIELPQARGRVTAREALALVYPRALETSAKPVLLIVTSGTDITAEGRSSAWSISSVRRRRFGSCGKPASTGPPAMRT